MSKFIGVLLDWSEIWATLIPITVWLFLKPDKKIFKPIILYLWIALILYVAIDLTYFKLFNNNNLIYNILSITRLIFFIWFFALLNIFKNKNLIKIISAVILVSLTVVLIFEDIVNFNSQIFAVEGIILILYCIVYFLRKIQSEELTIEFDYTLYIIIGLSIYEAVCFPIFLFYNTLMKKSEDYAINIWDVHNVIYIVFCLFIARAFYGSSRYTGK